MNEALTRFFQKFKGIEKYKYAIMVLILGIILMCVPAGKEQEIAQENVPATVSEPDLEMRLEEILSDIEGAGAVRVLLSRDTNGSYTYQTDRQSKQTAESEEKNIQTVVVSYDGAQTPIETLFEYPNYRGAVIVCQGADKAAVRLAIVQAVSSATGLRSDHITVIKMKSN